MSRFTPASHTVLGQKHDGGPLPSAGSLAVADPRIPMRERAEHDALLSHSPESTGQTRVNNLNLRPVRNARDEVVVGLGDLDGQSRILEVLYCMSFICTNFPHLPERVVRELAADENNTVLVTMPAHGRDNILERYRCKFPRVAPTIRRGVRCV